MKKQTVVITCGGTGGHLFPGIAVAESLEKVGHRAVLLISEKKVDEEAVAKYGHLTFERLPAVAKPATLSFKMIPFLFRLMKAVWRAKKVLRRYQADAVLGMGGFTSLAPVYAGRRLGLRTFVHDSNALPGKANRLMSRFCDQVFVGLEAARDYFPKSVVVVTGTPVRQELRESPAREVKRSEFGLDAKKNTVVVFGGSQGAKRLNTIVVDAARILNGEVQWLHVAGSGDYERVKKLMAGGEGAEEGHHVIAFCDDMPGAYAVADLMLCRAGASSLTELAFLGLPSILVPYPHAADDHQTVNAQVFDEAGAGVMLPELGLDGTVLAERVKAFFADEELARSQSAAARKLAVDDAADRVREVVVEGF